MAVKPIPDGYHSVTPYLSVEGATGLLDFMKQAFGAQERFRMDMPGGLVGHAEVQIGDSVVMCADASTQEGEGKPVASIIHLYVEDVDKTHAAAVEAGATATSQPQTQFYGDRSGGVRDAWGNQWWISTHVEDVSPEEMAKRSEEWAAKNS